MADGAATVIGMETRVERELHFKTNNAMVNFCGAFDKTLADLEAELDIIILKRGDFLVIQGEPGTLDTVFPGLERLLRRAEAGDVVSRGMLHERPAVEGPSFKTTKKMVAPRTSNQSAYAKTLMECELSFGIGPAGTGKTYMAVAAGVHMLQNHDIKRLILSRPAVEAGERLGFLPGDMKEKVDPYMQPLYDALGDMIPAKTLQGMIEDKTIEIAPLAFMRGRTLSNAFVLLDEAQNASSMQMKMFLTRLGEGSRMVITGDPGQVDLPRGVVSGLSEAVDLLDEVKGIGVNTFTSEDVVRHPLVARIIKAYGEKRD